MSDRHNPSIMSSILHTLVQNPHIPQLCPPFVDKRQFKQKQINAFGDMHSPVSPLGELFSNIGPILLMNVDSLWTPPPLPVISSNSASTQVSIPTLKSYSTIW